MNSKTWWDVKCSKFWKVCIEVVQAQETGAQNLRMRNKSWVNCFFKAQYLLLHCYTASIWELSENVPKNIVVVTLNRMSKHVLGPSELKKVKIKLSKILRNATMELNKIMDIRATWIVYKDLKPIMKISCSKSSIVSPSWSK